MTLRIIAGELRGRKLRTVRGRKTRPTADRIREAIFNILGSQIRETVVLDLFAGTGAFGFEGFHNLFAARYRLGDQEATVFFQSCRSHDEAIRLVDDYRAFLEAYGGVAAPMDDALPNGYRVRLEDTWTLIFPQGATMGGVLAAATPAQAERLAHQLAARLAASR